jgi:hypothetical protein
MPMIDDARSEFVQAAMRDGAVVRLDERGLMPLEEASEFRRGEGRMIGGAWVLDSDRLWAALLSLEDADELVAEATRLRWFFHPRGRDNVAVLERYGPSVLRWLRTFVRPSGVLVDVPSCVRPCLLRFEDDAVFDLLWTVKTVVDGLGAGPGPFAPDGLGDADQRLGPAFDPPAPDAPDATADALVRTWIFAHPSTGCARLASRAKAGDERALRLLADLARHSPAAIFGLVASALGEAEARAIFARAGVPTDLDEGTILALLDRAVEIGAWPELFGSSRDTAYHAMRLIAARARGRDGWGIVFQRIEGDGFDATALAPYLFGPHVPLGYHRTWEGHALPFHRVDEELDEGKSPFDLDGMEVVGPRGPLELASSMIAELDLRPGRVTGRGVTSSRHALALRAYLTRNPGAFWGNPREAASLLNLGEAIDMIVVSDAFEHCLGLAGPAAYPAAWRVRPSDSPVYRSLARALVSRYGSDFQPGDSNLDFRLHALIETGELGETTKHTRGQG